MPGVLYGLRATINNTRAAGRYHSVPELAGGSSKACGRCLMKIRGRGQRSVWWGMLLKVLCACACSSGVCGFAWVFCGVPCL